MPRKKEFYARHKQGLQESIEDPTANGIRTKPRTEKRKRTQEEDELMSAKLSGRILKAAREQQEELDADEIEDGPTLGAKQEQRHYTAGAVSGHGAFSTRDAMTSQQEHRHFTAGAVSRHSRSSTSNAISLQQEHRHCTAGAVSQHGRARTSISIHFPATPAALQSTSTAINLQ
eukprot:gene21237-28153_t